MKKMIRTFFLASFILAALFFAACGDKNGSGGPEGVTYTLAITGLTDGNITIMQGGTAEIGRTLTASDGSSTATGFTFTYACKTHAECGISVNTAGTQITVAQNTAVAVHTVTASAVSGGKTVAATDFTVTVTLAEYSLTIGGFFQTVNMKHDDEPEIVPYTLVTPGGDRTGITLDTSYLAGGDSGITVTNNFAQNRLTIEPIPVSVAVGEYTFKVTVMKDGNPVLDDDGEEISAEFTVRVAPKFTLSANLPDPFVVARGQTVTVPYTLTASDGTPTDGFPVGLHCITDYESCDLLGELPWGVLTFVVPEGATLDKVHSVKMQADRVIDEDTWEMLDAIYFNIRVQAASAPVKITVTPGAAVSAAATDTTAAVTFNAANAVAGLTSADFTLSSGASFAASNPVEVDGAGTAITVNVTFAANTETTAKTYTVGVNPNSEKIAGESVTITQAAASGPSSTVTITPGNAEVDQGDTRQFSVAVTGEISDDVTWSIVQTNTASGTSISATGLLTVAIGEPNAALTIRATSADDSAVYGEASVTVTKMEAWIITGNIAGMEWPDGKPARYPDNQLLTQNPDGTFEITFTATQQMWFIFYLESTKASDTGRYWQASTNNTNVTPNAAEPTAVTVNETEIGQRSFQTAGGFGGIVMPVTATFTLYPSANNFKLTVPRIISGVTVTPAAITKEQDTTQQFGAVVAGQLQTQAVTWSIEGGSPTAAGSSINSTGLLTISATEPVGSLTVRATSVDDTAKFGTAVVTVIEPSNVPTVTGVTINYSGDLSLIRGSTVLHGNGLHVNQRGKQFGATVSTSGGASEDVFWSIVEIDSTSSISSTGFLTIAMDEPNDSLTIKAAPVEDGFDDKADTVTVTIVAFDVWIVGAGVSWDTTTKMIYAGNGIYKWTGSLAATSTNREGVGFSTSRYSATGLGGIGWGDNATWFCPSESGTGNVDVSDDTPMRVYDHTAQNYFSHTTGAGTYNITLDTAAMTATFVRE